MKKILFILPIIALSACSSTPSEEDCLPEKNYIKSNQEAMDKYKEEFKNEEIEGLYYDISLTSTTPCKRSDCISFNYNKHKFAEFYFDDKLRKGVYTSHWSNNKRDEKCQDTQSWMPGAVGCFYLVKNNNDEIKSKYGIYMRSDKESTIKKFYNIKNHEILYEYSSTIYMTGALGGPGYGICGIKKENINNINYRFNPIGFPSNPLQTFD
jgi:hypothetical protein